jgi:CDP-diacylglycerol--glycerol-3-phosphate 3-phosphatidyltransferase
VFDGQWRTTIDRGVKPIGNGLTRLGVTPDQLTALGLVMAVATCVTIASGHLFIGFFLLVASALPDLLDGAVAKASNASSVRGAFFDSVADRVTDALLLGGIGWHLQETRGGRFGMLAFAVLGMSALISYQRAKAEIFGFDAKGGLMERAERIIAICIGLVFPVLLVPVLWIMLALTGLTAVQRFAKVWRQAGKPPAATPIAPRARSARGRRVNADRARWSTIRADRSERPTWLARWGEKSGSTSSFAAAWRERVKQRDER